MDGGSAIVEFDESTPPNAVLTGPATFIATIETEVL
jgi:hypothetical protein